MMKTKVLIWTILLTFFLLPDFSVNAQTELVADCFASDLGGVTSAGNPDVISIGAVSGSEAQYFFEGCLTPSDADYNDLFRIFIPEGYELSAIQMGYISEPFFEGTLLRMGFWYGADCNPLGSPDLSGVYGANPNANNLSQSILFGLASLPGNAWYSFRIDTEGWPSSMLYHFHFTLTCADNVDPVITTPAGSLNANLSCSNLAGIDAALNQEPTGNDDSGSADLVLISDNTIPAPGCPNGYTRTRIWVLEDACGNQSSSFTQIITVTDNTPPTFTSVAGSLDATLSCSNAGGLAAALAQVPSGADACGSATAVLQSDITTPDPECPNAYVRVRTWRMEDACENQSLAVFHQTITVLDDIQPVFSTAPGALNATLECSDLAGIAAAEAAFPSGTDNCGPANLVLFWDVVTPDPNCPNAYIHERVWRLVDACGNQSAENYIQVIQVEDNTAPVVFPLDGPVAIADVNGYELQLEDVIDIVQSQDACGGNLEVVSIIPSMVTCDQLGLFIPVEVTVADKCGNETVVVAIKEVTEDLSIKPPFDHTDIGVSANGGALHHVCDEEFEVWSSGFSSMQSDVMHYVYLEMCGDGEIIARVKQVQPMGVWGGLMVREDLTPGSRKMALETTLSNMVRRDIRSVTNGVSTMSQWPNMPGMVWLKINRTGNMFNLHTSMDGINWQFRGASQLVLQECVLMGIYAESINNMVEANVIFDNVSYSGGVSMRPDFAGNPVQEVAVHELTNDDVPVLFPNPGSGNFWLKSGKYTGQDLHVEMVDLNGRIQYQNCFRNSDEQIYLDLNHLKSGIYFCRIVSECGGNEVIRIIVE